MAKRRLRPRILLLILAALPLSVACAGPTSTSAPPAAGPRDGSHDFDWDIGAWRTHQRRLLHPLTGSHQWVDYHGTDVVRKLWTGADTGMIEADGPAGRLEIFTIRLYDPQSHQWSILFTNPATGKMSPALTGGFKHGRAAFYDQERYEGREIYVRFTISDLTADSCRFEQAFSDDGGRRWEVNFIVTERRMKEKASA